MSGGHEGIYVHAVVDNTGSMKEFLQEFLATYNQLILFLRDDIDPIVPVRHSLSFFGGLGHPISELHTIHNAVPIQKAPGLNLETFPHDGKESPVYYAMRLALENTMAQAAIAGRQNRTYVLFFSDMKVAQPSSERLRVTQEAVLEARRRKIKTAVFAPFAHIERAKGLGFDAYFPWNNFNTGVHMAVEWFEVCTKSLVRAA